MGRDLTNAAETLEGQGWRSALVCGAMRQAMFFPAGTALLLSGNTVLISRGFDRQVWPQRYVLV